MVVYTLRNYQYSKLARLPVTHLRCNDTATELGSGLQSWGIRSYLRTRQQHHTTESTVSQHARDVRNLGFSEHGFLMDRRR